MDSNSPPDHLEPCSGQQDSSKLTHPSRGVTADVALQALEIVEANGLELDAATSKKIRWRADCFLVPVKSLRIGPFHCES